MTQKEINKTSENISATIQGLWQDLSQIKMALQDVEAVKSKDYSWLDDEATQAQKESYINREIGDAKKKADRAIKNALMGILKKSNEIADNAASMIEKEIEY